MNARGLGQLRVNLGTLQTTPTSDGGACTTEQCSDFGADVQLSEDWQPFELPFDELWQPGWATPAEWKP